MFATQFKPTRVTQDQLSKLQEPNKRRLKMKSKMHKKTKGGSGKLLSDSSKHDDSSISNIQRPNENTDISSRNNSVLAQNVQNKHQKLHWD